MNNSANCGKTDSEAEARNSPETSNNTGSRFTDQRTPRIPVSKKLVRQLVSLGVPDESGAIGRAISSIATSAIAVGHGWMPSAADVVKVQVATAHRLEEIATAAVSLGELLEEIDALLTHKHVLAPLGRALKTEKASHE